MRSFRNRLFPIEKSQKNTRKGVQKALFSLICLAPPATRPCFPTQAHKTASTEHSYLSGSTSSSPKSTSSSTEVGHFCGVARVRRVRRRLLHATNLCTVNLRNLQMQRENNRWPKFENMLGKSPFRKENITFAKKINTVFHSFAEGHRRRPLSEFTAGLSATSLTHWPSC